MLVNLGDDADTTGAIRGQIAGAHYGAEAIAATWRHKLTMGEKITSLAGHLHDQASVVPTLSVGPRRLGLVDSCIEPESRLDGLDGVLIAQFARGDLGCEQALLPNGLVERPCGEPLAV